MGRGRAHPDYSFFDPRARSTVINVKPVRVCRGLPIEKYTHYSRFGRKGNEPDELAFASGALYVAGR